MLKKLLSKSLLCITVGVMMGQSAAIAATPYVASVQGHVELKRKTASDAGFQIIKKGPVTLKVGDQLRLSNGAIAQIACPGDKSPTEVRQAGERLGLPALCPKWKPVIDKGPPPIVSMGGTNAQIPYLISPRRTLILSATPTFRWNPVAGATQYTIQVSNAQGIVWQTQVKAAQVTYPGNPALQPGMPYTVVIQTNTGKSSQSDTGNPFLRLRETDAKVVQAEISLINQSDFSPEIKALKLAEYYTAYAVPEPTAYGLTDKTAKSYRLNADAIAVLESSLKPGKSSPLFYRMLGDLYAQTGVMRPAEQAYLQAIEQVQSLADLEEWSLATAGLGELYENTQDRQSAIVWYGQARIGFTFLDDQRAIVANWNIARLKQTALPLNRK